MRTFRILHNKKRFRILKHTVTIRWLYLFNLLTGRRLQLRFISEPGAIIFSNSYFTICWEVSGCYQVTINNNIVLPGNISFIRLDAAQLSGPLQLHFYGCLQTIEKTYTIRPIELRTKQLSGTGIQEPKFRIQDLYYYCEPPSLPQRPGRVSLPSIILPATLQLRAERYPAGTLSPALRVLLEPCELPQYNP